MALLSLPFLVSEENEETVIEDDKRGVCIHMCEFLEMTRDTGKERAARGLMDEGMEHYVCIDMFSIFSSY